MPELQDGIPIPPRKKAGRRLSKGTETFSGTLRAAEVGQSTFTTAGRESVRTLAEKIARETGFKFERRSVVEDGVAGTRVWRVG